MPPIKIIYAGVEITPETVIATRQHFADLKRGCIEQQIADGLSGANDHTFTFAQRAHWIQTGVDVPMFSR